MLALRHLNSRPAKPGRAVVIGAGGMVGGSIVRELARSDIPALALTRKEVDLLGSSGSDQLKSRLSSDDAVVFVSAVAPAKNAAQLMANLRMAEAAIAAFAAVPPAHLVYISSDAVYADDANPVTERSPVAPSTIHGMMHAARELMFRSEYRGPFAALRPTLIYGARDPHSGYGPNRFRRQAAKGEPITIFGEGEEKRDHVAVEDVARLAVRILLHRSTGALNAATGVATSFHDIAHIVARQFGPPQVKSVPRPGPRPHLLHRFFDITQCLKAFPDFHFEPLERGLARVHREVSE
jgi:nucleoside-diphosphate-sugar epimerase